MEAFGKRGFRLSASKREAQTAAVMLPPFGANWRFMNPHELSGRLLGTEDALRIGKMAVGAFTACDFLIRAVRKFRQGR
jgi:hypothetical protein